jgi:hypothetical protein
MPQALAIADLGIPSGRCLAHDEVLGERNWHLAHYYKRQARRLNIMPKSGLRAALSAALMAAALGVPLVATQAPAGSPCCLSAGGGRATSTGRCACTSRRRIGGREFADLHDASVAWLEQHFQVIEQGAPWLQRIGSDVWDFCKGGVSSPFLRMTPGHSATSARLPYRSCWTRRSLAMSTR